jgi:uncharacterized protein (TIGR03545 family)
MDRDSARISGAIESANRLIENDVAMLREQLGLPQLARADLSTPIFGPRLLDFFEPLWAWLSATRRYLRSGNAVDLREPARSGTDFHFAKEETFPRFLLARADFATDVRHRPHGGFLGGWIEALVSPPSLYGKPLRISLRADFPGHGVKDLKAEILVDHTRVVPEERLRLRIGNLPVTKWQLGTKSTLTLALTGRAEVFFEATVKGDDLAANGRADFREMTYQVRSPNRDTGEALEKSLASLGEFAVTGSLGGEWSGLDLEIQSELGRRIASGLREALHVRLAAVDDTLRKELLDEIDPAARALEARVQEVRRWAGSRLEKALKKTPVKAEKDSDA